MTALCLLLSAGETEARTAQWRRVPRRRMCVSEQVRWGGQTLQEGRGGAARHEYVHRPQDVFEYAKVSPVYQALQEGRGGTVGHEHVHRPKDVRICQSKTEVTAQKNSKPKWLTTFSTFKGSNLRTQGLIAHLALLTTNVQTERKLLVNFLRQLSILLVQRNVFTTTECLF